MSKISPEHQGPKASIADAYILFFVSLLLVVTISKARLLHILHRRSRGNWEPDSEIINNLVRDLKVICQRTGTNLFTLHDLRRSCITNWSKKVPVQTVQHLVGHLIIEATRKYYLSVQQSGLRMAGRVQSKVMTSLTNFLTNSGQNRQF